MELLLN